LVRFSELKITETNFPTLSKDQTQEVITELEKNIPDEDRLIALDRGTRIRRQKHHQPEET
jgi:hypothetical protein